MNHSVDSILLDKYGFTNPYYTTYKSPYQIDIDLTSGLKGYDCFIDYNDTPECLFYKLNSTNVKGICLMDCRENRASALSGLTNITHMIVELKGEMLITSPTFPNVEVFELYGINTNSEITCFNTTAFPNLTYIKIRNATVSLNADSLETIDIDFINTNTLNNVTSINSDVVNACYPQLTNPIVDNVSLTNFNTSAYYLTFNDFSGNMPTFSNCPNLKIVSFLHETNSKEFIGQIFTECPALAVIFFNQTFTLDIQNLYQTNPNVKIICSSSSLVEYYSTKFPNLNVIDISDSDFNNMFKVLQKPVFKLTYSTKETSFSNTTITTNDFDFLKYIIPSENSECHLYNFPTINRFTFLEFWKNVKIILHGSINTVETFSNEFYNLEFAEDACVKTFGDILSHNSSLINPGINRLRKSVMISKLSNMIEFERIIADTTESNVILSSQARYIGEVVDSNGDVYVYNSIDTNNADLVYFNLNSVKKLICRCPEKVIFRTDNIPSNFTAVVYNNYLNYLELKSLGLDCEFEGDIPEKLSTKFLTENIINQISNDLGNLTELVDLKSLDDSYGKLTLKINSLTNLYELNEFITETGSSELYACSGVSCMSGITSMSYNDRFSTLQNLSTLNSGGVEYAFSRDMRVFNCQTLKTLNITAQNLFTLQYQNIAPSESNTSITRLKMTDCHNFTGGVAVFENCAALTELDVVPCKELYKIGALVALTSNLTDLWYNRHAVGDYQVGTNDMQNHDVNDDLIIHLSDYGDMYKIQQTAKFKNSSSTSLDLSHFVYDVLDTYRQNTWGVSNSLLKNYSYFVVYDVIGAINWNEISYERKSYIKRLYPGATKLDLYSFESLEYLESKTLEEVVLFSDNLNGLDLHGNTNLRKISVYTSKNLYLNLDGCTNLVELNLNAYSVNNFDVKSDYLKKVNIVVNCPDTYDGITHVYLTSNTFDDEICINENVKIHYSGKLSNYKKLRNKLDENLNLKNNILPYKLTNLETFEVVFDNKISFEEIDISIIKYIKFVDVVTIPSNTFANCSNLEYVDLSDVQYIQSNAFENCTGIENIRLDKIKVIGTDAFKGCNLTSVYIGNNCELIKPYAFETCNRMIICSGKLCPESIGSVYYLELKYFIPFDLVKQLSVYAFDIRYVDSYRSLYPYILKLANNTDYYTPDNSDLFYYFNRFIQNYSDAIPSVSTVSTGVYKDEFNFKYTTSEATGLVDGYYPVEVNSNVLIWRNVFKYSTVMRNYYKRKLGLSKVRRLILYVDGSDDISDLGSYLENKKYLSIDIFYDSARSSTSLTTTDLNFPLKRFFPTSDNVYFNDINIYVYQNSKEFLPNEHNSNNLLISNTTNPTHNFYKNSLKLFSPKCFIWNFVENSSNINQLENVSSSYSSGENYYNTYVSEFYVNCRHNLEENSFIPSAYQNKSVRKIFIDGYNTNSVSFGYIESAQNVFTNSENLSVCINTDAPIKVETIENYNSNDFENSGLTSTFDYNNCEDYSDLLKNSDLKGKTITIQKTEITDTELFKNGYNGSIITSAKNINSDFTSNTHEITTRYQNLQTSSGSLLKSAHNITAHLPNYLANENSENFAKIENSVIKDLTWYVENGNSSLQDLKNVCFENLEMLEIPPSSLLHTFVSKGIEAGPIYFSNIRKLVISSSEGFSFKDSETYTSGWSGNVKNLYLPELEYVELNKPDAFRGAKYVIAPNIKTFKTTESNGMPFVDCENCYIKIKDIIGTTSDQLYHFCWGSKNSYFEILNNAVENRKKVLKNFKRALDWTVNDEIHLEEFDVIEGDEIFIDCNNTHVYLKSSVSFTGSNLFGSGSTYGKVYFHYIDTNVVEEHNSNKP